MITAGVIGSTELILILITTLFFLLLPIIAVIDILRSRFNGNDNILFLIIVLLLPIVGSIIYFIVGPSRKINRDDQERFRR